jgi:3' terminal RNA ribose 2'-O-methyltransferase Hen1
VLLTVTTTHAPATDLGFLLHKNPSTTHAVELAFGRALVLYPEATPERCTAALLLDVDPVGLVRGRAAKAHGADEYVSDRPYVASSFLSVALARLFGTALGGRSKERPELAATAIPLEARLACVPASGPPDIVERLFGPLGYELEVERHVLDPRFPEWGDSRYVSLTLRATTRLADLLSHLYVLVPVLDGRKHYYIERGEVDKLLLRGEGWLAAHPARELIVSRYLHRRRSLVRDALERLVPEEGDEPDDVEGAESAEEAAQEPRVGLHAQRLAAVHEALRAAGARRVLDLGCGEGRLLRLLLTDRSFSELVGVDVSSRALDVAASRLRLDRMPQNQRDRIRLLQGSLVYRDPRLEGFDAAAVVEVVEHLDPWRLEAFERVLFAAARPPVVVLTTPNREYNARYETLPSDRLRHDDHRFEWTRDELRAWAEGVAGRRGYAVALSGVGPEDAEVGAPSQLAVFTR